MPNLVFHGSNSVAAHTDEPQPPEGCTDFTYCSICKGWFKPVPVKPPATPKYTLRITVTDPEGNEGNSKLLVYPDSETADDAAQAAFDAAAELEEDDIGEYFDVDAD